MQGKKIENLTLLQEKGFPVPPFRVIPYAQRNTPEAWDGEVPWQLSAVRSSADVEDGGGRSFAGQFDTFLNVPRTELPEKIAACFASAQKPGLSAYQKIGEAPRMNVIVQEMVASDLSGVVFTANPQGLLNETVIVCGRGLGEGVVSGAKKTTAYYYNTTDKLYYYEGEEALLTKEQVEALVGLAQRAAALLGELLDLEFAIAKETIYVLQARAITTLNASHPLILDNSNIVESYPGLSLPLTCSFVQGVYTGIFKSLARRVLRDASLLRQCEPTLENMVGSANGRLYYKISSWYTVLSFLPFSRKLIPVWQEMMGVHSKAGQGEVPRLSLGKRAGTYLHVAWEFCTLQRQLQELEGEFARIWALYRERSCGKMEPPELIRLYRLLQERLLAVWDLTLLNDIYAFAFTGLLKKRLRKKGVPDEALNRMIAGIADIESLKPVRALAELSALYETSRAQPQKKEAYQSAFAAYLEAYGDRSPEELKLESKTFRSDPALLQRQVEAYAAGPGRERGLGKGEETGKLPAFKAKDPLTAFLAKRSTRGIRSRELSRLNRSRIFGMVRSIYLALGSHFVKAGVLENARDVFWLEEGEAFSLAEEEGLLSLNEREAFKARIQERKERWRLFEKLPAYSRLVFAGEAFDKRHRSVNAEPFLQKEGLLQGSPCSGGMAEGEALVVRTPEDLHGAEGKILIAGMTDPGWVFWLVAAKGLVSEKGSLLSHTAIVCRELKIPAVMGAIGAVSAVKTGDWIRVDGDTGAVKVLLPRKEREGGSCSS